MDNGNVQTEQFRQKKNWRHLLSLMICMFSYTYSISGWCVGVWHKSPLPPLHAHQFLWPSRFQSQHLCIFLPLCWFPVEKGTKAINNTAFDQKICSVFAYNPCWMFGVHTVRPSTFRCSSQLYSSLMQLQNNLLCYKTCTNYLHLAQWHPGRKKKNKIK